LTREDDAAAAFKALRAKAQAQHAGNTQRLMVVYAVECFLRRLVISEYAHRMVLDSVIDRPAVRLNAYPLALNLAEKIVTAMQRRDTSTRDRDFADLCIASRVHRLDARKLRAGIVVVADHRRQPLIPMSEALRDLPDRQSPYTAMVERMSYILPPPAQWRDLIAEVVAFIDPLIADHAGQLSVWDLETLRWS
jgi:hypothetical protein